MLALRDIPLPGTSWPAGRRVVVARLRPLTGWDELAVAERHDELSALELGLLLAERCVAELVGEGGGAVAAAGPAGELAAGELSAGDREAVLLRLRQQALGDRVSLVATCPDLACGQRMDLDLSIQAVLAPTATEPRFEVPVRPGLVLRRPNGADQQAVAGLAQDDPAGAVERLLWRCVVDGQLDAGDMAAAAEALDRADPQAHCRLRLACPACGEQFEVALDAADLLRRELASQRELDLAVHMLAAHYHWTEDAILSLPLARRRRYVEVLDEALGAGRGVTW